RARSDLRAVPGERIDLRVQLAICLIGPRRCRQIPADRETHLNARRPDHTPAISNLDITAWAHDPSEADRQPNSSRRQPYQHSPGARARRGASTETQLQGPRAREVVQALFRVPG